MVTNNGWIKLHRKFLEWEWYTDSNVKSLFIHLIISANHEPNHWQGIEIQRGQLITGRRKLSEQTGLSERSIRTCMRKLKSTGEVTSKTTNKYSIITICKYDNYQSTIKESDQQNDQQTTTNKKDKNSKNLNNRKEGEFIPPTQDEMIEYFKKNDYPKELALKAWETYNAIHWIDTKGNKIKNWKLKSIAVWFMEKDKIKHEPRPQYLNPIKSD